MTTNEFEEFYNYVINNAEFKGFTLKQVDNVITFDEWRRRYQDAKTFEFTKNSMRREN